MKTLTLISHPLCPYVQRAVIALSEKGVSFKRIDIDLANKPDWFKALSPLGKTPVLVVDDTAIFESAVILEYLEETQDKPLHPADALRRAEHRSWIEFGSAILADIAGVYSAPTGDIFSAKTISLSDKFALLEARLGEGPFFNGPSFSLVDAVYAPIFRYFDTFDRIADFGMLNGRPRLAAWRETLAARRSVCEAVADDYPQRLWAFLAARHSHLSGLMPTGCAPFPDPPRK